MSPDLKGKLESILKSAKPAAKAPVQRPPIKVSGNGNFVVGGDLQIGGAPASVQRGIKGGGDGKRNRSS